MLNLKIDKINVAQLSEFISSVISISEFVYMRIIGDELISTCYLPQKDAVKQHRANLNDVFTFSSDFSKIESKVVKVAFFDGIKVLKALSHFSGKEISGILTLSEEDESYTGSSLMLVSDNLTIELACAEPTLGFTDIPEDKLNGILSANNYKFNFTLEHEMINKLKSLFKLESDKDTFKVHLKDNKVNIIGNMYNIAAADVDSLNTTSEYETTLYKKYISLLGKYNYKTSVCENKLVFESPDKNTTLTVAVCEEN